MKSALKLSVTLFLNQFVADIGAGMCVVSFIFMFGDSKFTYILFAALTIGLFYYMSYNSAYKIGFHDIDRHAGKEKRKAFVLRAFLSAVIACSPTIVLFVLWKIGQLFGIVFLQVSQFPLFLWTLYGYWPLSHIFPNHITLVYLTCIVMQICFPMFGYVCGYKGIVFSDKIRKLIYSQIKS